MHQHYRHHQQSHRTGTRTGIDPRLCKPRSAQIVDQTVVILQRLARPHDARRECTVHFKQAARHVAVVISSGTRHLAESKLATTNHDRTENRQRGLSGHQCAKMETDLIPYEFRHSIFHVCVDPFPSRACKQQKRARWCESVTGNVKRI